MRVSPARGKYMERNTIKAIIIEDDREALSLLEAFLKTIDAIDVIGSTTKPRQGMKLIQEKIPDIVFLDIDMPGIDGIKVAEFVKKEGLLTEIVFTTAYSHYAFHALPLEPFDYLVKPFGIADLLPVIERYDQKIQNARIEQRVGDLLKSQKAVYKIKLPTAAGIVFIEPDSIMLCKAESKYCRIFTKEKEEELIYFTIQKLSSVINLPSLLRVNRTTFINLQYLKKIDKKTKTCILEYEGVKLTTRTDKPYIELIERTLNYL